MLAKSQVPDLHLTNAIFQCLVTSFASLEEALQTAYLHSSESHVEISAFQQFICQKNVVALSACQVPAVATVGNAGLASSLLGNIEIYFNDRAVIPGLLPGHDVIG